MPKKYDPPNPDAILHRLEYEIGWMEHRDGKTLLWPRYILETSQPIAALVGTFDEHDAALWMCGYESGLIDAHERSLSAKIAEIIIDAVSPITGIVNKIKKFARNKLHHQLPDITF